MYYEYYYVVKLIYETTPAIRNITLIISLF